MASKSSRAVLAAGVVAFRPGRRVLLIHRQRYDDWSFPKGKLDPGEQLPTTAVREAAEETGLDVRLGPPLPEQRYTVAGGRSKVVSYWTARVVGDDDVAAFVPNDEVDAVAWVPADKAARRLTYPHDRETLERALELRRRTVPLVVLRHAQARSRKAWRGDDRLRTLLSTGRTQAQRLVPLLSAYGPTRVVSSTSTRCVQTVTPYTDATGCALETTASLSEQDASTKRLRRVAESALASVQEGHPTLLCSHRPVLPGLLDALGEDDPSLAPGEMLVLHVRRGRVVSRETHRPC